ncbi:outer membrane lipoprotein carrier protein LolA, partial [Pseudomonas extremaustralis]|nr:outer membrane lipoprotein carrier protein LolA [Pseudomonas extremaustralis]
MNPLVGASLLAKVVNDDSGRQVPRGILEFFASKLAPMY